MTAPAVPRGTKAKAKPGEELVEVVAGIPVVRAAKTPRPVASLDDILLELVDIDDNVRDDVGDLAELKASIAELGLLSPVKVTTQPSGRYRLVYGQRRVLACRELGRLKISAIVEPASDVDASGPRRSIEQLAENLQRKDLNPIEEAVALREVLDGDPSLTQEALADMLAMSRPWVSNTLGLLGAPATVQDLVRAGRLTASHAKAVRGLAPKTQSALAREAVENGYSAHRLEDEVQRRNRIAEAEAQRNRVSAELTKKNLEQVQSAIDELATKKKPGLDGEIIVFQDYGGQGDIKIQALAESLKKAGFTNVRLAKQHGEVAPRPKGCDCTKATASGWAIPGGRAIGVDRILAEIALWGILSYRLPEWSEKHGGTRTKPWATLHGLTDEELAKELAWELARDFRDKAGYHVDWVALAAELGVSDVLEEPAKPAKGKAKAAP